ncbi:MAG TPA: hypothetical protein DCL66_00075, partial [Gammaproteobacteria bacterium]|nr:hypothetical protein [Gammaproteobacteria bacterium]
WHQNFGNTIQVIPMLRYYNQSAADFFTNVDDFSRPATDFQSSDYRLSAFGAISAGLTVKTTVGDWDATLTGERYLADEKYSAFNVSQPSAALIRYFRVSLGLDFSF